MRLGREALRKGLGLEGCGWETARYPSKAVWLHLGRPLQGGLPSEPPLRLGQLCAPSHPTVLRSG